jgi:hypothetical protein
MVRGAYSRLIRDGRISTTSLTHRDKAIAERRRNIVILLVCSTNKIISSNAAFNSGARKTVKVLKSQWCKDYQDYLLER